MGELDFSCFDVLTFDCFGTLIDWEAGILAALRPMLASHGASAPDDDLLESYARHEAAEEAGPYRLYREVMAASLRGIGADFGFQPTEGEQGAFALSIGEWPAFSDSAEALARLHRRYRLGVITNCDDDLFALAAGKLGVEFDWVVSAEQVGAYKPSHRNFERAFELIGVPRERILHVAQSLFHDHVPAKQLGLASVWVDRRRGKAGSGATPPADAEPDLTVAGMREFADLALG